MSSIPHLSTHFLRAALHLSKGILGRQVRAIWIAEQLGLGYNEALAVVDRLRRDGWIRGGSRGRVLSDLHFFLTPAGIMNAQRELRLEPSDVVQEPGSAADPFIHFHPRTQGFGDMCCS